MAVYYNEFDPYCAQWLRNLMAEDLIPAGEVDERDIRQVQASELVGFDVCHFFAGLGGWAFALRLAGVPDDYPLWTGSCPCQPFSGAGKRKAFADPRHLWPVWQSLIAERHPSIILGEQVAKAPDWLALVRRDLDSMDYAMGAMPIEAASAGADHFRDRYFFVAHANKPLVRELTRTGKLPDAQSDERSSGGAVADSNGESGKIKPAEPGDSGTRPWEEFTGHRDGSAVAITDNIGGQRRRSVASETRLNGPADDGVGPMADTHLAGLEGWQRGDLGERPDECAAGTGGAAFREGDETELFLCPDGKWRRSPPPGVRWVAHGIPARASKLRALGNAIDTRPAVAFIQAALGAIHGR